MASLSNTNFTDIASVVGRWLTRHITFKDDFTDLTVTDLYLRNRLTKCLKSYSLENSYFNRQVCLGP